MKNAEKFKEIFKEFATEVWAFPEKDFLTWLNAEYIEPTNKNDLGDEYISRSELMAILSDYYDTTVEYRSMLKEIAALPVVIQESTTKNDLAQERYQDLKEYFGDNESAKTILEDKKEFKAWLERLKWNTKKVDELARELEQLKTTKNDLGVNCIDKFTECKHKCIDNDLGVDCISREEAIKTIQRYGVGCFDADEFSPEECERFVIAKLNELPPVTPQEPKTGHCKDCKWWKDSDGAYRRGVGAESQCPINRREVFEGNGYCYMFEPQESEET